MDDVTFSHNVAYTVKGDLPLFARWLVAAVCCSNRGGGTKSINLHNKCHHVCIVEDVGFRH